MTLFRGPENPRGIIDRFTTGGYRDKGNPFKVTGHPGATRKGFGDLGSSFANASGPVRFDNMAHHAIVLEDTPVGADARLEFESFPGQWEESYRLKGYRKMGGHRMPQPQFATYQGGDWGPFPLTLVFRAGIGDGSFVQDPQQAQQRDIESILITMERKVWWCIALGFPLEKQNVEAQRILASATATGALPASSVSQEQVAKLKRNDPPFVLIILGTWRVIRGYLTTLSWTWKPPFHPVSGRPYGAEIRMSFQPIMPAYPTWNSIRNMAGTAGASGPITERLPAADQQRIVVTNNLNQNAAARSAVQ